MHAENINADDGKQQGNFISAPYATGGYPSPVDLGTRIRRARRNLNLYQRDIARQLRVKQATVSLWESGKLEPEFKTLIVLAAILRIELGELMGDGPPIPPEAFKDAGVRRLVYDYLQLDPKQRKAVGSLVRLFRETHNAHQKDPLSPEPPKGANRRRRRVPT